MYSVVQLNSFLKLKSGLLQRWGVQHTCPQMWSVTSGKPGSPANATGGSCCSLHWGAAHIAGWLIPYQQPLSSSCRCLPWAKGEVVVWPEMSPGISRELSQFSCGPGQPHQTFNGDKCQVAVSVESRGLSSWNLLIRCRLICLLPYLYLIPLSPIVEI